jgi:hypothetical protein
MQSNKKTLLIILAVVLGCFVVALVPLVVLGAVALYLYAPSQPVNDEFAAAQSPTAQRLESWQGRSANDSLAGNDADTHARALARIKDLERELAMEKAARRQALAALETRAVQLKERVLALEQRNQELLEAHRKATEAEKNGEMDHAAIAEENPSPGGGLADVRADRDELLERARELADQVHEARSMLEQRREQLTKELAERQGIMDREHLSEAPPADVSPPAERDPPAELSGIVTNVSRSRLIEVSVGSDDGVRNGHQLDVFDQDRFVTRAVVLKTTPQRAVCKIIDVGPAKKVEKGYRVVPRSEE